MSIPNSGNEYLSENAQIALAKIHALELARAKHLLGTARQISTNARGEAVWEVPSRSQPYRVHLVTHGLRSTLPTCDCKSVTPCSHIGAVLHGLAQRDAALAQAHREYDAWQDDNMGGSVLDCLRGW